MTRRPLASHPAPSRSRRQAGFALSELLLVLVFATGLLLVAYTSARNISNETAESDCQTQLRTLKLATEEFHAQSDTYPTDTKMLVVAKMVDADDVEHWEVSFTPGSSAPVYRAVDSKCRDFEP